MDLMAHLPSSTVGQVLYVSAICILEQHDLCKSAAVSYAIRVLQSSDDLTDVAADRGLGYVGCLKQFWNPVVDSNLQG